jgi:hypothetical protein
VKTVSIVVPVYHNDLNLPRLFPRLSGLADANPQYGFEYIFVEDCGSRSSAEFSGYPADCRKQILALRREALPEGSSRCRPSEVQ